MPLALPIRIGLVGLGRHGIRYARHLSEDLPDVRLAAVARRHLERGLPLAGLQNVAIYEDPAALIGDTHVDAVVAVTPPALFPDICRATAAARKPLLVEKPLAPTAALARDMLGVMAAASAPLMVAHTLRFNSAVMAFRNLLPLLGPLRRLSLSLVVPSRPRPPGNPGFLGRGPLLDLGVHLLDLVRWVQVGEVRRVTCRVERRGSSDVEEAASVELHTISGCFCALRVGWEGTTRVGSGEAIGDQGRARVDWLAHRVESEVGREPSVIREIEESPTIVATLRGYLRALAEGGPMPVSAEEGLEAVRLVDACYESARRETAVDVEPS